MAKRQARCLPANSALINELANAAFRNLAGTEFSDRERFAERYRERYGEATSEEIEASRLDMIRAVRDGRVMLADKGGAAFSAGIEHAAEQALLLFEFDWSLLYCEESFVSRIERSLSMIRTRRIRGRRKRS